MSSELLAVCTEFGIAVVHPAQHRPFTPMHTAAGNTLEKILRHEGEDHLRDVLTALTESENNKNMLIAPVIKAVSRIMAENPTWYASNASKFLEVMDRADLPSIYMKARQSRNVVAAHDAIAVLLLDELRKVFRAQEQVRLI